MRAADRIRHLYRRLLGMPIYGVMVLPYAPDGTLILIRQTYTSGWCLPGGGRRRTEVPVTAALRELREEIGLTRFTGAAWLRSFDHRIAGVPASIDLIQVDGVECIFTPNFEVEAIEAFDPDGLPDDLNRWSARFIAAAAAMARTA